MAKPVKPDISGIDFSNSFGANGAATPLTPKDLQPTEVFLYGRRTTPNDVSERNALQREISRLMNEPAYVDGNHVMHKAHVLSVLDLMERLHSQP